MVSPRIQSLWAMSALSPAAGASAACGRLSCRSSRRERGRWRSPAPSAGPAAARRASRPVAGTLPTRPPAAARLRPPRRATRRCRRSSAKKSWRSGAVTLSCSPSSTGVGTSLQALDPAGARHQRIDLLAAEVEAIALHVRGADQLQHGRSRGRSGPRPRSRAGRSMDDRLTRDGEVSRPPGDAVAVDLQRLLGADRGAPRAAASGAGAASAIICACGRPGGIAL